ncbi:MAG: diguanylate cyclase [Vulcanimicrobiaceae bacterium]
MDSTPSVGTILVVDDEIGNIEVLAGVLEAEYDVAFATSGAQALDFVGNGKPDLVLLDVVMPDMDGYEVFRRLKEDPSNADLPVIFITGLTDSADETRGLELGAVDYVTKPFTAAVVRARVRNHVELKRARDKILRLARTDGLTGVANRRQFDDVLEVEYKRHVRSKASLSLILLDLDYFKAFNDAYGHVAGDECLRAIANALASNMRRPADVAARYGGEEFACVLPETDLDGARSVAERIRDDIERLDIPHRGSRASDRVTTSIGIVSTDCIATTSPVDVVTAADANLYRAKATGRDRIVASQRSAFVA